MIRNAFFNFKPNLREAARFRLSLRNSSQESELKRDIESLFLSEDNVFDRLRFFNVFSQRILKAESISSSFKNFSYFTFYESKNLALIKKNLTSFKKESKVYFENFQKELNSLKEISEEIDLEYNSKYTKVKVFNKFLEKNLLEQYDFIDNKTNFKVDVTDIASVESNNLTLPVLYESEVSAAKIEVDNLNSFESEVFLKMNNNPVSNILKKDVTYTRLVVKKENLTNGMVNKNKEVKFTFVVSFNVEKAINKIVLDFASELPIDIVANEIKYYKNKEWQALPNLIVYEDSLEDAVLFFDEIYTNKIQIQVKQTKYYDTVSVQDEKVGSEIYRKLINGLDTDIFYNQEENLNVKVYDLSIRSVSFYNKKYKSFGIYRESEIVNINKPISFSMDQKFLIEKENVFLEKEAHVVLYGDNESEAFKTVGDNYQLTPRVNDILPLPTNLAREVELLFIANTIGFARLFPDLSKESEGANLSDRISVYEDDIELIMYTDYQVSLDGGSTFIEAEIALSSLLRLFPEKTAGDFCIKFLRETDITKVYKLEYLLGLDFYLNQSKTISLNNGKVIFSETLQDSVGFIRPRLIFRSKSSNNESSILEKYKLFIEELPEVKEYDIEYETFEEITSRSTSNVV